jgi:hypothetical protein
MGQDVHQDRALSLLPMHALMTTFDREWTSSTDPHQRFRISSLAAYCVICFCGSFRGPEGFLVDLFQLRKYLNIPWHALELKYVIIPLLGKVKNEHGECYHLTPLCSTTSSGLQVEVWIHRLVQDHACFQSFCGPAFCNRAGALGCIRDYELDISDCLHLIQQQHPDLIPQMSKFMTNTTSVAPFIAGLPLRPATEPCRRPTSTLLTAGGPLTTPKAVTLGSPWPTITRIFAFLFLPCFATPPLYNTGV